MSSIYYLLLSSTIIYCATEKNIQSTKFNIISSSSNIDSDNVMETQHTNCKISTDQLIADAHATVTRVLTGGCNAKTIDERFGNLERILTSQLKEIKDLVEMIFYLNDQRNIIPWKNNEKLYLKSPRECEIEKFNVTLHEISELNVSRKLFNYYWRIEGVKKKLFEWGTGRSERSNTFYIKDVGYAMFIKFTPKYFPDGTIFISVGLTKGRLDAQLPWPFSPRLRIEILDHSSEDLRTDRRSMIWDPSTVCPPYFWGRPGVSGNSIDNPECVGLSMPKYLLYSSNKYLWNDNLFIKLTIFI
ncbi:hypothetical protein PV328_011166 [Microctonus aethiopoides]|uniref:MATH domain-containing protein n=1 Tax=Microctonus aethiopoides TaxID=144406 RepID=A0AA39C3U4_9HYME|nr:hypothetical protein PV328_011166 [Microctonus aethiopoides]